MKKKNKYDCIIIKVHKSVLYFVVSNTHYQLQSTNIKKKKKNSNMVYVSICIYIKHFDDNIKI